MSARLLENPGKVHEISDDIEAFVHVLRWMTLRFYPHGWTGLHDQLRYHVITHFERYDIRSGEVVDVGGMEKKAVMLDGADVVRLKAANSPLGKLLDELRWICQEHYRATEPAPQPRNVASELGHMVVHTTEWHSRWAEIQASTPSAAISRNKAGFTTNDEKPTAKLVDHHAVGYALVASYMALSSTEEWKDPPKTNDQFAHPRYKSALMQRSLEHSSNDPDRGSSGQKRRLLEAAGGPPTKRTRSSRTGQLAAVSEDEGDE